MKVNLPEVLRGIKGSPSLIVDVETSGLHPFAGDFTCCIGLATPGLKWEEVIPVRVAGERCLTDKELKRITGALSNVPELIGHNLKSDLHHLARLGYWPSDAQVLRDNIVLGRLSEHRRHPELGLKELGEHHLGPEVVTYEETFKEKKRLLKIRGKGNAETPWQVLREYNLGDLRLTDWVYTLLGCIVLPVMK